MYVIIHKNMVVLGIVSWNANYFINVLKLRYNVITDLPKNEPDLSSFPYIIDDDTVIKRAEEDRPGQINPMIEYYYGPSWEFVEDKVIAHYEVKPLSLDDAKSNYREKASKLRYEDEISGTKIVIGDIEYAIETTRESRTKYIEKYTMMDDQPINWKFVEGWQVLTKQDMFNIIRAIDSHVQSAFNNELSLVNTVNQSQTVEELLSIEELNKVEVPILFPDNTNS